MSQPKITQDSYRTLGTAEAMQRLHYRSRQSFWQAVYQQGIPHIRVNARHIVFPEAALNAWIQDRTVGATIGGAT
jgi:predicted DNA-binding transcriptional regulator AlpA